MVQPGQLGPGGRVEHPRRPVVAGGGDPGAIRVERHRVHRAVMVQPGQLGPGGRLEHPRRPVVAGGGDPGASGLNATAHTGPSWSSRASVRGCRRRTLRRARSPCTVGSVRTDSTASARETIMAACDVRRASSASAARRMPRRWSRALTQLAQPCLGRGFAALDERPDCIRDVAGPGVEPAPCLGDPRLWQRIPFCGTLLYPGEPVEELGVVRDQVAQTPPRRDQALVRELGVRLTSAGPVSRMTSRASARRRKTSHSAPETSD